MKKLFVLIIFIAINLYSISIYATGLSPFIDVVYWHASQETSSTWANVVTEPNGKVIDFTAENVSFDWDLGFRTGVGYSAGNNFWDSKLYWTHFSTNTSNNLALNRQLVLPEFFSGFISGNYFFGANINWRIVMNMYDYTMSHRINLSNSFLFRPWIGVKAGTINQTVNCAWKADIYTAQETLENKFFGVGPSFGIDTNWAIYKNFSLFGNFGAALMWGKWDISDIYSRPRALGGIITATTITTNLSKARLGTLMMQYCLGLEWTHKGRVNFSAKLGYEMQFWANQLRLPTFQQLPVHGDLTLQGGTCRIIVDL